MIDEQKRFRQRIQKFVPKQKLKNGNLGMYDKNINWLSKKNSIEREQRMKSIEDANEQCSF